MGEGAKAEGWRPRRSAGPLAAGRGYRLTRGVNSALFTLFVVGALVLVNVLAARHPLRADFSPDRRFQLSRQTREVLGRLEGPVDLYAFLVGGGGENEQIRDLLREYRLASRQVRVHIVDPEQQPSLAREMEVRSAGTVVVQMGSSRRAIEPFNLFAPGPTGVQFRGEQAVTRAIMELVGYGQAVIYFLEGHGEGSPEDEFSALRSYLEGEGFTVKTVNLALANRVPEDARVVVLGGPRADLAPKEREMLVAFVEGGGRLAVWIDPLPRRTLPEVEALLSTLGVRAEPGVVVDPGRALFGDALSPVPDMRWHEITRPLIQANSGVVLPGARPVKAASPADGRVPPGEGQAAGGRGPGGMRAVPLLVSTDRAWAELNPVGQQWRRDPEDVPGPLELAVAVERDEVPPQPVASGSAGGPQAGGEVRGTAGEEAEGPDKTAVPVAVVVGNSAFARNASLAFQGNRDLAANMLTWLAGQSQLVTIRPKSAPLARVLLTGREATAIFYGTTVGIPALILVAGVAVWWRRRSL